eukprot:CAMPEP_0114491504 /NCGR_PEP_ID=MMETSP0109-20121206/3039_1 /TAXON_ID=29199 /ORGANISM="Chlorarachnion reptans, Strain CCCM449" /LENGTH=279 /DNA_ID=CAMNT_0001668249 /DNA_START=889 /DNA_END=1726 /DNA_ORIENTATION=-
MHLSPDSGTNTAQWPVRTPEIFWNNGVTPSLLHEDSRTRPALSSPMAPIQTHAPLALTPPSAHCNAFAVLTADPPAAITLSGSLVTISRISFRLSVGRRRGSMPARSPSLCSLSVVTFRLVSNIGFPASTTHPDGIFPPERSLAREKRAADNESGGASDVDGAAVDDRDRWNIIVAPTMPTATAAAARRVVEDFGVHFDALGLFSPLGGIAAGRSQSLSGRMVGNRETAAGIATELLRAEPDLVPASASVVMRVAVAVAVAVAATAAEEEEEGWAGPAS